MTEDDSEHVRAALAMVATELAPILERDATITHLVPPILLLLRDAASEVRLNLISSLESLNKVIGVDLLSQSLLPAILDLAQDGKWRYVKTESPVFFILFHNLKIYQLLVIAR
jgi:serine/threonine-protein phosphatase 2A regulatory subunit A